MASSLPKLQRLTTAVCESAGGSQTAAGAAAAAAASSAGAHWLAPILSLPAPFHVRAIRELICHYLSLVSAGIRDHTLHCTCFTHPRGWRVARVGLADFVNLHDIDAMAVCSGTSCSCVMVHCLPYSNCSVTPRMSSATQVRAQSSQRPRQALRPRLPVPPLPSQLQVRLLQQ